MWDVIYKLFLHCKYDENTIYKILKKIVFYKKQTYKLFENLFLKIL